MTFEEAMRWCRRHQAIWGFGEGPLGHGKRLWLRVQSTIVERMLPSWSSVDPAAVLTEMVERMRARLAPSELRG